MARSLRPNIGGGVYHVMSRGNYKMDIYRDGEDRERFLKLLAKTTRRHGWECLAYCLMTNHYHLVLRTPLPNLSPGMRLLNSGYAAGFNARHHPPGGHVFQGRFRSVLIRSSQHLLTAMKYVLRNPVSAGLCASPEEWSWSSYRGTVTADSAPALAREAALSWFGDDSDATERFAHFISSDTEAMDETLVDDVEFPREPTSPDRPRRSVEEVLTAHPGAPGIAIAYREHGHSLAQIAAVVGRDRSTVSRWLVAYESGRMLERASWPCTT